MGSWASFHFRDGALCRYRLGNRGGGRADSLTIRTMQLQLPEPSADARAASHSLQHLIADEIRRCGGWISFARYMELALYAPGLGYYSGGSAKLGKDGDFTTAPELSPLFGAALAQVAAAIIAQSAPNLLEFGAGTGKLAFDILTELRATGVKLDKYYIVELSGELRGRQQDKLRDFPQVEWLDALPASFDGVVFGNEQLPAGYVTELHGVACGFMATLARMLEKGTANAAFLFDYGFPAHEYYFDQRVTGTLMCHYRHHAHADPFYYPGLQDITAHVDFTAMALAAQEAGIGVLGYLNQSGFLLGAGIGELLLRTDPADALAYLPQSRALQKLVSPAEMGELFKVLAVGKGVELPEAIVRQDRTHRL